MIELTDHDKRVLSTVGHGAYGRELLQILDKVKKQVCSLEGLEEGGDHNTAVEGRLLFKKLADEFIRYLSFEPRAKGPPPEGRANYE